MRQRLALIILGLVAATVLCSPAWSEPDSAEISYWESVRDSKTPAELESYLKAYPDGAFAALARIRLRALKGAEPADPATAAPADGESRDVSSPSTAESQAPNPERSTERLTLTAKLAKKMIGGQSRTVLGVMISEFGNLAEWRRACFGLEETKGVLVNDVIADSSAKDAGINAGDIVRALDGEAVDSAKSLVRLVAAEPAGVTIKLEVIRPSTLKDSAKQLVDRAKAGDAAAMDCLGYFHANGFGVAKNAAEAVGWYRKGAEAGDANAMTDLAISLDNGTGVAKNVAEANRWYQKGAEAGNSNAMTSLAVNLQNGAGITKDAAEANRWYRKAAEAGNVSAMTNLAFNLQYGTGITKDAAEANRWYRKAAEAGSTMAMNSLAINLENGNGITKDVSEANRWYRKAAEAGNADAMSNLAVNLQNGSGITKDVDEASRWYRKAADTGNLAAMQNLGAAYDAGAGVEKDPRQAAQWVFKALKGGNAFSQKQMNENASGYSKEFRREFQRLLAEGGYYDGDVDGDFGSGTQRAVDAVYADAKKKAQVPSQSTTAEQPQPPASAPSADLGNLKDLEELE